MSEFWKVVKFSLFSFSAGLIQMGSFALLHECTNLGYWPSYLFSLLLSVLWNFTLNRKFTFHSAANIPVAMAGMPRMTESNPMDLAAKAKFCTAMPASTLPYALFGSTAMMMKSGAL